MKRTASLIVLAIFALIVSDARAQEASVPVNAEAASEQLQRTPTLVIREVIISPANPAVAAGAALKVQGAPMKNAAPKSPAAGAPSVSASPKPIVIPAASSASEMGTTGNPKYDELIALSAATNGVDPNLILAVMRQESGFNLRARSYKGALGLMQLMPATAQRFGVANVFDPAQNIEGGARYLRFLLDSFGGDVNLALAGYNAGENAVVNSGYRVPRYRQTQNYVRSISARYDRSKDQKASAVKGGSPVAPSAQTFSNGRLSNNY